jgi:hypothetical protein
MSAPGSLTPEAHYDTIAQAAKARYEASQLAFHNSVQGIDRNTIAGQAKILALGKGAQADLASAGAEYKDASMKVNEMRLNRYGDAITRAFWNTKDPQAVVAQYGTLMQALGVNPSDYSNAKFDTPNPNGARDNKGALINKEPGVTLGNGMWVPNYLYAKVASGQMSTTDLTKILHDEDMKKQDFDEKVVMKKYEGDNAIAVAKEHGKYAAAGVYAQDAIMEKRSEQAAILAGNRTGEQPGSRVWQEAHDKTKEQMLKGRLGIQESRNESGLGGRANTRSDFDLALRQAATISASHSTGAPFRSAFRAAVATSGLYPMSPARSTIPQAWIIRTATRATSPGSPARSASARMVANDRR